MAIEVWGGLDPAVMEVLAVITLALLGATAIRSVLLSLRPGKEAREGWRSLGTWWLLYLLFLGALILGRAAVFLAMLGASILCLREALGLVRASGIFLPLAFLNAALFGWAWLDWVSLFTVAVPACLLLLLLAETLRRVLLNRRHPKLPWRVLAFLAAVVGPSFLLGVSSFPTSGSPPVSWRGWLVALVVLTELNDIAQAWWGRALGSRPMAPVLSPRKTWAGLLGGVATTVAVSLVLLPTLTPVGKESPPGVEDLVPAWVWSALLGGMVSLAGVGGDLAVSLLKRRRCVKDAGDLLPAQGGVLDRFDSLALTAPVYLTLTSLLWIRPW